MFKTPVYIPFVSLKTKLIILSLIVSTILTAVLSIIGIGQEIKKRRHAIETAFLRFENNELAFFTDRMWLMDYGAMRAAAANLVTDDEITGLLITDRREREIVHMGDTENQRVLTKSFPLIQEHNNKDVTIGTASITATLPTFWQLIRQRLVTLLMVNGILVAVIFTVFYIFFYRTVLRDLSILTQFTRSEDFNLNEPKAPEFISKRLFPDEISQLTESINEFTARITREFSRRKHAEDAMKQSEYRHRIIFENSPLGMIRMNHEGIIQDCNRKFIELMGSSKEKLIGFNGLNLSNPKMRQVIQRAISGEQVIYEDEYTSITGGKKSYLRVIYNPVNPNHSPTDVIATLEDVSSRKEIEDQLRTSGERLQAIFRAISDPILIHPQIDTDFLPFSEITEAACKRYGYSHEEMLGLSILDVTDLSHTSPAKLRSFLHLARKHGHTVFETLHRTADGRQFPADVSLSSLEHNGVPSVLWVVRDLTERDKAEQEKHQLQYQLQQAQKLEAVGRLAGGVAHDFNNMLGVILGYTEMALEDVDDSPELQQNLLEVKKAADYSADLTKQLLAFARKQPIMPKLLDLNQAISEIEIVLNRLTREGLSIKNNAAEDLWLVNVDPSQIKQILVNLTINARDAIEGDGTISISTRNQVIDEKFCSLHLDAIPGEYVVLTVSDTGEGMTESQLANIFEPFYTTKPQGEGTGLGLATVYGILKQNNGFITVSSFPGQGTTFDNYFPRYREPEEINATSASKREKKMENYGTILLVEDEEAILTMVAKMISQIGYTVLPANTPVKALEIARDHADEIQVLMTDVIMPEMNGRQLADTLRDFIPQLRCLFISGYTADVIAEHGVLEPGISFLQKPFTKQTLIDALSELFSQGVP